MYFIQKYIKNLQNIEMCTCTRIKEKYHSMIKTKYRFASALNIKMMIDRIKEVVCFDYENNKLWVEIPVLFLTNCKKLFGKKTAPNADIFIRMTEIKEDKGSTFRRT